jgi:hypothetical protein
MQIGHTRRNAHNVEFSPVFRHGALVLHNGEHISTSEEGHDKVDLFLSVEGV